MRGGNERSRHEVPARMDGARPKLSRAREEVLQLRAEERNRDFGSKRAQFFPLKRGDDDVPLDAAFENELLDARGDSVVFQFDIQQALSAEFIQDIGQKGNRLAESGIESPQLFVGQIADAAMAVGCAVNRFVMNDNQPAVAAAADVEFEARRSRLQRFPEGSLRVFAATRISWGPTMSEDDHV